MMIDPKEKDYEGAEAQERFEAALKGALKTPHKPLKPKSGQTISRKIATTTKKRPPKAT